LWCGKISNNRTLNFQSIEVVENNNIRKHWQLKKLGDLCEKISNGANVKQFDESAGLPISRIETIWNEKIDYDRVKYIKENDITFVAKYSLKNNDILFSHINSDMHLGKTAIFKNAETKPLIHGVNLLLLRPLDDISADFLNYQLKFLRKSGSFAAVAQKSVNQSSINQAKLKSFDILVPPFEEQLAIVSKIEELFSELDNGIDQLKTAQQQLKVYRQSLLKAAFEGRLTNENIQEGELPQGWKWVTLGDVCTNVEYGSSAKSKTSGRIPVLRMGNIQNGRFDWSDLVYTDDESEIEKYTLKVNDVLFNRTNSAELVGKTAIYKGERPAIFAGYLIRINRIEKEINADYLTYYLNTHSAKQYGNSVRSFGVNQSNINGSKLKTYPIPLAPLKKQKEIVQELESKLTICDKIEETINNSLQQAESLRQSILKKAFAGKLVNVKEEKKDAKVIPIYKPQNEYFYQVQVITLITKTSKEKGIAHGEMTLAKYAYLADKIFGIPTCYDFQRWHLGPYPKEIKKAINNKKFFTKVNNRIELVDEEQLLKYNNPYREKIELAINELTDIFLKYKTKDRAHETELLATVCKVVEDIQRTDLKSVRKSMAEWKIELKGENYKTKAEKFTEAETKTCLQFLIEKGWDKKLLK
jgi:type I restriction enzyme, S subunit